MKELILAAGESRRLRPYTLAQPKGLMMIQGMNLLERVIFSSKLVGIDDFIIVTGYQGEKIRKYLGDGERYGVSIEYVYNKNWKRGNAFSLLSASGELQSEDSFLLSMSDNIFDPIILKELSKQKLSDDVYAFVGIDKDLKSICDFKGVTKIRFGQNDRIEAIGKRIRRYNAVDCGLFLYSSSVFKFIEKSISKGKISLSEVNMLLASQGKLKGLDITGSFWFDVDTPLDKTVVERVVKMFDKMNIHRY